MSDAVSESTWRHVENGTGKKLRPSTTAAIAAILQWPADALARIAAGEDPASRRQASHAGHLASKSLNSGGRCGSR